MLDKEAQPTSKKNARTILNDSTFYIYFIDQIHNKN
jgi:DNA-dependent RNA polymerase auxiliary subunit epsilon